MYFHKRDLIQIVSVLSALYSQTKITVSHWIGAFVSSFEAFEAISDSCQPQLAGKRGVRERGERGREGGGEKGEEKERNSEKHKIHNHTHHTSTDEFSLL